VIAVEEMIVADSAGFVLAAKAFIPSPAPAARAIARNRVCHGIACMNILPKCC
jgi:hypothetical protein